MLRSLYSGISGLHAHQQMMDVTGNNIANVNTVGFKASTMQFQDTLSQMLGAAGAPQNGQGGSNPAQVGLGVANAGILSNWAQGSQQTTGRSGDMMIQGDGFFVTRSGNEMLYTRAGSFSFDANGLLVTATGEPVQGWTATDGVVNASAKPDDIRMPLGSTIAPKATETITLKGNLSSDVTPDPNNPANTGFGVYDPGPPNNSVGYETTIPVKVYDAQGATHTVVAIFHRTNLDNAANPQTSSWDIDLRAEDGTSLATDDLDFSGGLPSAASLNADGKTMTIGAYTVDLSDVTSFSGISDARVFDTDGQAAGALTSLSYTVNETGQILGVYSNGMKQVLGQVAMATFKNVNGLEKTGNSSYRSTVNSGYAQVGQPGSAGMGGVVNGALEMSNVDLAQEFTNLVIAQRGFQANSRIITTSDELLQELVSMKR
ncbi:flagellar hook protein FlgE [Paractinoplanes rishiriensis]|uniref:Flagellar hook protein FlgE n=1 Tax=Paractinoplanes rishiriensis TaxID=1050105 RepID=A0A919K788_9ACTN|nr:flagellar hook protein FlgE [Actinoplanes rishiriensis]GIE97886.1 flagellar hook protein FlgE [Actinoplanes rishiriensis]